MFGDKRNITIIGAGKIAHSLTPALLNAGYEVGSVISTSKKSAEKLAEKYSINIYSDDYSLIPRSSEFYILCVPDSSIKEAALQLSRLNLDFNSSLFIHLSGAEDISLLDSLKMKNASTGSLHIMQTFPSVEPIKISGSCAAIETNTETVFEFLNRFSKDLELRPFRIKSENKSLYHLAGVYSSNFLSGNMFIAEKLLSNILNGESIEQFELLAPIIEATLKNIKENGPVKSLSGPVERGDIFTVKKHIAALNKLADNEGGDENKILKYNYIHQSLMLLEVVRQKYGALSEGHIKIKELFEEEIKNRT